jgi:nitrogen regulatory protein P-II 1
VPVTKIEAIVRPWKLDEVRRALTHPWITGMTVSEVKGFGNETGRPVLMRDGEHTVEANPRLKVELVVPDPLVPRILHDLERSLRTGNIGDGKLFVVPLCEAVRIRTGERGEEAL